MPARIEIPPERLANCRYLYEETNTPVSEIWKLMGVSRATFYARVAELGWVRRRYSRSAGIQSTSGFKAPAPAPDGGGSDKTAAAPNEAVPAQHVALSVRVYDAVQRQMDAIESIQRSLRPAEMQSERTVRILAALNKALREIAAISKPDETIPSDANDNDPVPHDIDKFRRELARRIKGLVDAERACAGEGSGEASAALAR
jgi:hypothetical protein